MPGIRPGNHSYLKKRQIIYLEDQHSSAAPDALQVRIPLSGILVDSWVTEELRSLVFEILRQAAQRGDEWLGTLPAIEPIELSDRPVVLIIDGISPDV